MEVGRAAGRAGGPSMDQEQQDINEEAQKRKAEGEQTIKAKKVKKEEEVHDGMLDPAEQDVKIGRAGAKKMAQAVQKLEAASLDVQGKIAQMTAPDMREIAPQFFATKLNSVLDELQKFTTTWKPKGPDDKAKKSEILNLPAAATELCQRGEALGTQVQGIMQSAKEDL